MPVLEQFPNQEPLHPETAKLVEQYEEYKKRWKDDHSMDDGNKAFDIAEIILNRLLPRSWNSNILPGFTVIAIDERDPIGSEQGIGTEHKPSYPLPTALLNDPHWIRFERLKLEFQIGDQETIQQFYSAAVDLNVKNKDYFKAVLEDLNTYPTLIRDLLN